MRPSWDPVFALLAVRPVIAVDFRRRDEHGSRQLAGQADLCSGDAEDHRIAGLDNLFCGGEKAGLLVGHTEAIVTGTLAGHNAARQASGQPLLRLPTNTAIGDFIAYTGEAMQSPDGRSQKYTFSGSVYFARMKQLGLYTTDRQEVQARVAQAGVAGIFGAHHMALHPAESLVA